MLHTNLDSGAGTGMDAIAAAFERANPGHELDWRPEALGVSAAGRPRVLLVQAGEAAARVRRAAGEVSSDLAVGDVLVLAPGESVRCDSAVDLLVFSLPLAPSDEVPRVIRPDWDPRITDTPGGCATDEGAYRRILLTWLGDNGPYTFRGLNVHRVRIDDSFTHYHPREGGFDEFYLVQAVRDGARILTSEQPEAIERPESIQRDQIGSLLTSTGLAAGDLVYLPRGTAHRGLGGVLAQVITVPGFVPGAEVGIDHHLRAINERFGLTGDDALPLHAGAADKAVVR